MINILDKLKLHKLVLSAKELKPGQKVYSHCIENKYTVIHISPSGDIFAQTMGRDNKLVYAYLDTINGFHEYDLLGYEEIDQEVLTKAQNHAYFYR